jgi:subtilisin family serine protease
MDINDLTLGSEFESQLSLLPLEEEEDESKTILEGILPAYVTLPTIIAGASHPQAPITTEPAAAASTMAKGIPSDPDTMPAGQSQWHLVGTWGLHADLVWGDYTGSGIMVGVMDDGFQYTHHEISANYRTDLDRDIPNADNDPSPIYVGDNHGTSVIGTIIADDNGSGGVGVAFDAQAYGIRLDFGGGGNGIVDTVNGFQYALTTGLDVMNNSWGYTTQYADTIGINFAGPDFIDINNLLGQLTANGRGGMGSNIVFSAGNSRGAGDNVNYHNMQNSPYTIAVAAIDSDGTYSVFSTPGAALLVSAGGTQVYTTDRTGALGYNGVGDYTNFSGHRLPLRLSAARLPFCSKPTQTWAGATCRKFWHIRRSTMILARPVGSLTARATGMAAACTSVMITAMEPLTCSVRFAWPKHGISSKLPPTRQSWPWCQPAHQLPSRQPAQLPRRSILPRI